MDTLNANVMHLKNFTARNGRGFRHRGTGGQYIKGKWMDVPLDHVLQSCPAGFACFNVSCPSDHFLTQRKNLWIADSAGRFMSIVFTPGAPYGVHCTMQKSCMQLWIPGQTHECTTQAAATPVQDDQRGGGCEEWLKLAHAARTAAAELRGRSAKFAALADDKDAEAAAWEEEAVKEEEAQAGFRVMQAVVDQPLEKGGDDDDTK